MPAVNCGLQHGWGCGTGRIQTGLCFWNWFLLWAHMSEPVPAGGGWAGPVGPWGPFSEFSAPERQARLNLGQMAGGRCSHAGDVWLPQRKLKKSASPPNRQPKAHVSLLGPHSRQLPPQALCGGGAGLLGQRLSLSDWICFLSCGLLWPWKDSSDPHRVCPRRS